jgi:hypothetical protein
MLTLNVCWVESNVGAQRFRFLANRWVLTYGVRCAFGACVLCAFEFTARVVPLGALFGAAQQLLECIVDADTWLILPAVICSDKRLSHACLRTYCTK